jgi:hypothetical protein
MSTRVGKLRYHCLMINGKLHLNLFVMYASEKESNR